MILMSGLGDLGVTCSPPFTYYPGENKCDCPVGTVYNPNTATCDKSGSGSSNAGFDWGSLLSSITEGAVKGFTSDGTPTGPPRPGQPGYIPPPPPTPWYASTTGMVGIGMGALVLFLLLRK